LISARLAVVAAFSSLALAATTAHAEPGDGAYGRLKGDVTLVVGAGGGLVAKSDRKLVTGDVRLRYLDAVGAAFIYEEANALERTTNADYGAVHRNFITALEIRPLFPIRFLKNMESDQRFFELMLDSIGLELGTVWTMREGNATRRPGLLLGLGFEVPLIAAATGPWLRFSTSVRWSAERLDGVSPADDPGGRAVVFSLGVAWHQVFGAHAVDAGDQRVE
jgi:hypothetical protein